jgi:hypothetical protein
MEPSTMFKRPSLKAALDAWKKLLIERDLSTDILWIFEENLCFEQARDGHGGFHPGFQIKFTPPSEDALDIAYEHFSETPSRIVFYRLGESRGKSICVLMCDPWFDEKGERESYMRHDEWGISFHPGLDDEIEEIRDLSRWLHRIKRGRAFHDLDFCMSLATIDEIKIHGRALAPYERFASTMLNRLRRFLGQST